MRKRNIQKRPWRYNFPSAKGREEKRPAVREMGLQLIANGFIKNGRGKGYKRKMGTSLRVKRKDYRGSGDSGPREEKNETNAIFYYEGIQGAHVWCWHKISCSIEDGSQEGGFRPSIPPSEGEENKLGSISITSGDEVRKRKRQET